jgi:phosphonate transport system permease protein
MAVDASFPVGRRVPFTARRTVLLLIVLTVVAAAVHLRLGPAGLMPSDGGLAVAAAFLRHAISPAVAYESDVPSGTVPLVWKALAAARTTAIFAATAMSLALLAAIPLGFLASSSWWVDDRPSGSPGGRGRRALLMSLFTAARVGIGLLRSIHELLWAVLLLAAFGLSQLTAVLAIAIPYAGILAKVFAEMLDEAPRDAALALRDAGASPLQVFAFGLVPRALPDMTAYAFYRFECALRSSAILGFFGFPTLGYFIAASFENLHYGEVWTYLYTLFLLVAVSDWWSGALRRRLVA